MQIFMLFPLFLDVNFGHDHVDSFSSKVELEEVNLINARPDSL